MCVCARAHSVMSDSATPWLLCPRNFPGKNTRVGCHFLLQGIFLTHGLNLCLLHWQVDYRQIFTTMPPLLWYICQNWETKADTWVLTKFQTSFAFHLFYHWHPLSVPRLTPGCHVALCCHVSLVYSALWQFLSLFLFLLIKVWVPGIQILWKSVHNSVILVPTTSGISPHSQE